MSDHDDAVDAAFDALRTDAQSLDVRQPLAAVTARRGIGRHHLALGFAAAIALVVVGSFVVLRGDTGDVIAGRDTNTASNRPPGFSSVDPDSLVGSSWTLESGRGSEGEVPLVDGWPITITFEADTLGGVAACNGYGASYSLDTDDFIVIGGLGREDMGCDGAVTASESAFLAALVGVDHIRMNGGRLVLSVGTTTELVFRRNSPVPVDELVGRLWLLDTLIQGDTATEVAGDPATLLLGDDGTVIGGTGCRTLSGRYTVTGNQVQFPDFRADGQCPSTLRDQDNLVVTVLGDGFRAEVDGDRLTLTSVGNEGLGYRAITDDELATTPSIPVPTDADLLAGTSWVLVQGEGPDGPIGFIAGNEPTILFSDPEELSGNLGCNDFGADVIFDGQRLDVSAPRQTDRACPEPGVMDAETAFAAALSTVTEFAIEHEGDSLVMTGDAVELLFTTLDDGSDPPPPPVEGGLTVAELLDSRPTEPVTLFGAAIDSGGGWIICDRADEGGYLGCGGRSVVVTNFDPDLDEAGPGSWDGSLADDGRFALSIRNPGTDATDQQMAIAQALADISVSGTTVDTAELPFAPTVLVGLGGALIEERTPEQLTDAANWSFDLPAFRGGEGTFSILETLEGANGINVTVGPHSHCASPPARISDQIVATTHLSIQPTGIDSCLLWFTVDLFLDEDARIVAITLDLWEP